MPLPTLAQTVRDYIGIGAYRKSKYTSNSVDYSYMSNEHKTEPNLNSNEL